MNSRRVQNSITGLEKDISKCETVLSKVTKGKIDKSKSNAKKCQNYNSVGSRERSVMTYVNAPLSRSPVAGRSNPRRLNNDGNHILHKEVFENSNATVEVTVKTKSLSSDKSRKRPRSNTVSVAETDGITPRSERHNSVKKQPDDVSLDLHRSDANRKIRTTRRSRSHSKNKHLSWAHILKDSNGSCIVHSEKDIKSTNSRGKRIIHSNKCKPMQRQMPEVADDSLTSTDVSETSTIQESVHFMNRSVQCYLIKNDSSGRPMQDQIHNLKPAVSTEFRVGDDSGSAFSMFNPVRTLNFLMSELRGKVKKCDSDDNLQRILSDMEQTLSRIPPDSSARDQGIKENVQTVPSRDDTVAARQRQLGFAPLKPVQPTISKPVVVPKLKIPDSVSGRSVAAQQIDTQSSKQNDGTTPPTKEKMLATNVQEELELRCAKLELNLKQLELKFQQQQKENKSLNDQVKSEKEAFQLVSSREKDYLTTVGYLKSNLETMTKRAEEMAKTISELSTQNSKLKEENKALVQYRDSEMVLQKRLKETTDSEEKTRTQLQILKIEREKFDIVLGMKNRELGKLKQDLKDIQAFVTEQLSSLKSFAVSHKSTGILNKAFPAGAKELDLNEDSDLESVTLFFEKGQTGGGKETEKQSGKGKQLVCSSPTSSAPSSMGLDASWHKISRISSSTEKNVKKKRSPEVVVLSPVQKGKMKDSEDDSDVIGSHRSYPVMSRESPEFKSFLVETLSDNTVQNSKGECNVTEPKSCEDLKNELREIFDSIKKQTEAGLGLSLPSPPHHYSEMSEPGGLSQWSEVSDPESLQNSPFVSISNTQIKNSLFDVNLTDMSVCSKNKTGN